MKRDIFFQSAMHHTGTRLFVCLLSLALGVTLILIWQIIRYNVSEKRLEMAYTLYLRAESLAWAMEGVARGLGQGKKAAEFSTMLVELARQPGIAWLAIVNKDGRIIADSNPELAGNQLYSRGELELFQAAPQLQGRIDPDDPTIFLCWKKFAPWRIRTKGHKPEDNPDNVIFIALDATDFEADINSYRSTLWLFSTLVLLFLLSLLSLLFYIQNYRNSRKSFENAKALARQVIDNYPAAMLIVDLEGRISLYNKLAQQLLSISKDTEKIYDLDWFNQIETAIRQHLPVVEREMDLERGQKTIPASLSIAMIADGQGNGIGRLIALRDLSVIKQLQQKLDESRKLAAMGHLAAGVAHEIRNPLSSICGYAAYLKEKLKDDPLGHATAELLEEEAQRLNSALSDLLILAKKPALHYQTIHVDAILHKLATLLKPDLTQKRISLVVDVSGNSQLMADGDRLLQSLLNLLLNAIQAVNDGGAITIHAQYLEKDDPGIPGGINNEEGIWLISIMDNGPGIAPDILPDIFTPYFTTRPEGTGIGLTVVHQIIEAHGGIIEAGNASGGGAVFNIFLPAGGNGE